MIKSRFQQKVKYLFWGVGVVTFGRVLYRKLSFSHYFNVIMIVISDKTNNFSKKYFLEYKTI